MGWDEITLSGWGNWKGAGQKASIQVSQDRSQEGLCTKCDQAWFSPDHLQKTLFQFIPCSLFKDPLQVSSEQIDQAIIILIVEPVQDFSQQKVKVQLDLQVAQLFSIVSPRRRVWARTFAP